MSFRHSPTRRRLTLGYSAHAAILLRTARSPGRVYSTKRIALRWESGNFNKVAPQSPYESAHLFSAQGGEQSGLKGMSFCHPSGSNKPTRWKRRMVAMGFATKAPVVEVSLAGPLAQFFAPVVLVCVQIESYSYSVVRAQAVGTDA